MEIYPDKMDVVAPTKNAIVVYAVFASSTAKNITTAITIKKEEQYMYSVNKNSLAPFIILANGIVLN